MASRIEEAGVDQQDVNHVNLRLYGEPIWDYLSVFIRDPSEPTQYWFRRLNIIPRKPENSIPVVDVIPMYMGRFDHNPCPIETLETAVSNMEDSENQWVEKLQTDPDLKESRNTRAVVGVAEYDSYEEISFDYLVNLVGVRYSQMQEEYQHNRNL